MLTRRILLAMTALPIISLDAVASPAQKMGGMWVWTTLPILTDDAKFNEFVNEAWRSGATQVFLYMTEQFFRQFKATIANLLAGLSRAGIRAYAMNGWRGYFRDAIGPQALYQCVEAMLDYNAAVAADERFVGFMSDMEPQDGQGTGKALFHNGVKESALTADQRTDRDALMADWLSIQQAVRQMLHPYGMRFAASLPFWTDNYFGEPVLATFEGQTRDVTHFLMHMVDDYCIMSYNTSPLVVESRIASKLRYADTLPRPPRVFGGVETHVGPGERVSYGDDPSKRCKTAVVTDLDAICRALRGYGSFSGMNIHDYHGWAVLPESHLDASQPHRPDHSGAPSLSGWWA